MEPKLSQSAQKVQDALAEKGMPCQVLELADSTRTAKDAAAALGCQVGQIVKSILFKGKHSAQPVMVIASGPNRINESRLAEWIGEPVEKADAEYVREQTGYAIGGVPPLGLKKSLRTFIDSDLLQYPQVWAAAGTPHAVFALDPTRLQELTGGQITSVL
jgi:prolyl-tRNA editing enzyme YbaK/EbsC (Cys-tRNA(Pro) deacylase)